ncbi:MAG: glucokinase [Ectothiorhodospiraceae bacterium]|nr:glucokinase [Chromatiales bacterium]MCP5156735.1 glucokinase [Ectothiorhodospiraceae bacterium]
MSSRRALLADVGGTNVRVAVTGADGRPGPAVVERASDAGSFEAVLARAARRLGLTAPPDAVAVCAAGPAHDGVVRMTNLPWVVDATALRTATGAADVVVVNDFTALAWSLPHLGADDLDHLGGPGEGAGTRAVIGPGTGLGVATLARGPRGWMVVDGEGGHVTLPATTAREQAVVRELTRRFGHASAERALSGPGLVALAAALAVVAGETAATLDTPEAVVAAADGGDRLAGEAVALFTSWLGGVAGNLALTVGARGGVYLAGGIVPAWGARFDRERFRASFLAKGRLRAYLEGIPVWLVTAAQPALVGLAALVADRAGGGAGCA